MGARSPAFSSNASSASISNSNSHAGSAFGSATPSSSKPLLAAQSGHDSMYGSNARDSSSTAGLPARASSAVFSSFVDKLVRKRAQRQAFREFLCYLPFLAFFMAFLLTGRGTDVSFFVEESIRVSIITDRYFDGVAAQNFVGVYEVEEIWQWIQLILRPTLWPPDSDDVERTYLSRYNKLVGALRMRQLRVDPQDCSLKSEYKMTGTGDPVFTAGRCFPGFSQPKQAKSAFPLAASVTVPDAIQKYVASGLRYNACPNYDSEWSETFFGATNVYYPCGGYIVDLPFTVTNDTAADVFNFLYAANWIDKATAVVTFEFFTYNAGVNMFSKNRIWIDFSNGGAAIPQWWLQPFNTRPLRYMIDWIVGACHIIFFLYCFYYFGCYFFDMYRQGPAKFYVGFWNWFDTVNLLLFVVVLTLRAIWYFQVELNDVDIAMSSYPERLSYLAWIAQVELQVNALNAPLSFMRVFRFLGVNARLNIIGRTLSRASGDLFSFAFMFVIVFLGFSTFAYITYGSDMPNYATFPRAAESTFFILLGNSEYDAMREVNRILTPLFFFAYLLLALFVLFNMFLAILNDSYAKSNEECKESSFGDQIKKFINRWFERRRIKKQFGKEALTMDDVRGIDVDLLQKVRDYVESQQGCFIISENMIRSVVGENASQEQVLRLLRAFRRFDKDNNNIFDANEMMSLDETRLCGNNVPWSPAAPSSNQAVSASPRAKTGKTSFADIASHLLPSSPSSSSSSLSTQQRLQALNDAFDALLATASKKVSTSN
jgi:hypothetical protein